MAIIGAAIGGATNYLAIKMIFRPYEAIYIGKWRLPFTPGLIPNRRSEFARQIGITVMKYLLTPEVLKQKIFSEQVKKAVLEMAQEKTEELVFTEEKTILDWMNQAGVQHLPETIEGKVDEYIQKQFVNVINTLSTKSLQQVLPKDMEKSVDEKIPEIVSTLINKGEEYLQSPKGELTLRNMIDEFLSSKGTIGGIFQMFISDSSNVVRKVQNEILKLLHSPGTKDLLMNILSDEWNKIKKQPVMNYLNDIQLEPILMNIQSYAKREMNLLERLNQPISYYFPNGNEWAKNELLPQIVNKAMSLAEDKMEDVLRQLKIEEVIREQVDSFPLEKLEELVVGIAGRELKMITILGGVLGGLIGIVQGVIVQFIN